MNVQINAKIHLCGAWSRTQNTNTLVDQVFGSSATVKVAT